jgi:hypothetical protein
VDPTMSPPALISNGKVPVASGTSNEMNVHGPWPSCTGDATTAATVKRHATVEMR